MHKPSVFTCKMCFALTSPSLPPAPVTPRYCTRYPSNNSSPLHAIAFHLPPLSSPLAAISFATLLATSRYSGPKSTVSQVLSGLQPASMRQSRHPCRRYYQSNRPGPYQCTNQCTSTAGIVNPSGPLSGAGRVQGLTCHSMSGQRLPAF